MWLEKLWLLIVNKQKITIGGRGSFRKCGSVFPRQQYLIGERLKCLPRGRSVRHKSQVIWVNERHGAEPHHNNSKLCVYTEYSCYHFPAVTQQHIEKTWFCCFVTIRSIWKAPINPHADFVCIHQTCVCITLALISFLQMVSGFFNQFHCAYLLVC